MDLPANGGDISLKNKSGFALVVPQGSINTMRQVKDPIHSESHPTCTSLLERERKSSAYRTGREIPTAGDSDGQ